MALEPYDHLSDADFNRLASFIHGYSGIKMPLSKKSMVEGRLRRRVRAVGANSLDEYCDYLFTDDGIATEAISLIDAVSTNKTDFFREPDHFRYLATEAVPALIRQGLVGRSAPLKVWSAAASVGAEAYTSAMVMRELADRQSPFRTQIVATDICTEVLKTAVSGIYPHAMIAPVPEDMRHRYLMRGKGPMTGNVRMIPELRAMVTARRVNLMERPYPVDRDMHVVFCRNILIYFDRPTQAAVLTELCSHLLPGGYLFMGHSETLAGFNLPLRQVTATVFMREDGR